MASIYWIVREPGEDVIGETFVSENAALKHIRTLVQGFTYRVESAIVPKGTSVKEFKVMADKVLRRT